MMIHASRLALLVAAFSFGSAYADEVQVAVAAKDRKSTRLNSSHT